MGRLCGADAINASTGFTGKLQRDPQLGTNPTSDFCARLCHSGPPWLGLAIVHRVGQADATAVVQSG